MTPTGGMTGDSVTAATTAGPKFTIDIAKKTI